MAVDEAYGAGPGLLNDDRIARALDAIAPHLDEITGSVGAAAITGFGVDVARLHWDMTSISLHGAYPDPAAGYPAPRWGHPKDRRPDLKQIQTGLAVSGDGGIPVFHHAYDGGAAEVSQVVGAMTALKTIAGPREFLLIGDSKLISWANVAGMAASVSDILCAGGFSLSGSGSLSLTVFSRYLMPCCPVYPAVPRNRTFRAVPGLMLRVPVFPASCAVAGACCLILRGSYGEPFPSVIKYSRR
jgi:hypothetical protein